MKTHIGMRKIKSLIALIASFAIWQLIRLFLPMLETHPLFAYIYSVIELRETPDKTKAFGKLRIKATFIGLIVGLVFITLSVYVTSEINVETMRILTELLFILLATLISLILAEKARCESFCGIAAIISIICMVAHDEKDIYLYAVMRVVQTLIGVFSAMFINIMIRRRTDSNAENR